MCVRCVRVLSVCMCIMHAYMCACMRACVRVNVNCSHKHHVDLCDMYHNNFILFFSKLNQ